MSSPIEITFDADRLEYLNRRRGWGVAEVLRQSRDSIAGTGFAFETASGALMREPKYDVNIDTLKADWNLGASGNFEEMAGAFGEKGKWLFQNTDLYLNPSEQWTSGTISSTNNYAARRFYHFCLYWYAPPAQASDNLDNYQLKIRWGNRYRLTFSRNRELVFDDALTGKEYGKASLLDQGDVWERLLIIKAIPVAWSDTATDWVIESNTSESFLAQDVPNGGAAPIYLDFNGAFLWSLKPAVFAATGSVTGALYDPGYDAGAADRLQVFGYEEPQGMTLTLPVEVGAGTTFQWALNLSGGTDFSQAIYGVSLGVDAVGAVVASAGTANLDARWLRVSYGSDGAGEALNQRSLSVQGEAEIGLYPLAGESLFWQKRNVPVEIKYNGVQIFRGLTGVEEREIGIDNFLTLRLGDELNRRAERTLILDAEAYDGLSHVQAVRRLLHRAGYPDSKIVLGADDGFLLPTGKRGGFSFKPEFGDTVGNFIRHIANNFSGWLFFQDANGNAHYEPANLSQVVKETLYNTRAEADAAGGTANGAYYAYTIEEKDDDTGFANHIFVIGQSESGTAIAAEYFDYSSLYDPTSDRYVRGEWLPLWYEDSSINSDNVANAVARVLAEKHNKIRHLLIFTQEINPTFSIGNLIQYGSDKYIVREIEITVDKDLREEMRVVGEKI